MRASKEQIKQIDRLLRRSDFLRVQKEGTKWIAKGFVLQALPNGLPRARFGLTVTKRLSKSAVVRNRIRRRLRAAAYDILALRAKPGFDYVLSAREEAQSRLYSDLCRDIEWCLGKIGCLRGGGE